MAYDAVMQDKAATEGAARGAASEWGSAGPNAIGRIILMLSRRTPLGRGAMRKRLARILRRIHTAAIDTHVWGSPVRLHPWKNASERKALMRPDQLDASEHRVLTAIMGERSSTFVDIGANAGLYSLHAALSSAPGGKILAIEPSRQLLERLAFNLDLALRAQLLAHDVVVRSVVAALSDYDGEGILCEARTEGTRHLETEGEGERVAVRRLNTVLREEGILRIDLLKIDVEGAEDRILAPFFATAPESLWPRTLIIEHLSRGNWKSDCIADCCARGYRLQATTRNNTILQREAWG